MSTERCDETEPFEEVPPGILRSQRAFWRELPDLLRTRRKGRWVAYHGDERVGFGHTQADLYRECIRRGYRTNEVFVALVEPHDVPPWEPIDIESSFEGPDEHLDTEFA